MTEKTMPEVFVFGSNEAGVHGAGAALHAKIDHGARQGCGFGYCSHVRYPNSLDAAPCTRREGAEIVSHSFAIPTKDYAIKSLTLETIELYVDAFLTFALARPDLTFKVTQIGCGLAGFTPEQIAPMFMGGQRNIKYDTAWAQWLDNESQFWGTM